MLGDLGSVLEPFEMALTVTRKTGTTITDGYIEPIEEASKSFYGAIVPRPMVERFGAIELGVLQEGEVYLYLRTTQPDCPAISVEDIIVQDGIKWKVTEEKDYVFFGSVKIFKLVRVHVGV